MATLSPADRATLSAEVQRSGDCPGAITKPDLLAAINAADDWADLNAAAYNLALPLPARTALTARQKAALLMYVIRRRYEVS